MKYHPGLDSSTFFWVIYPLVWALIGLAYAVDQQDWCDSL